MRESDLNEAERFYIPSLSSRTIVYKGLLLAEQLSGFYHDLDDETMVSALAMVHPRFSTNTFPTWELAQPFRMLCHNGEINTAPRQHGVDARARAAVRRAQSSARTCTTFSRSSRPAAATRPCSTTSSTCSCTRVARLPHVMMMLVPEAWQNDEQMPQHKKDFYEYHSCLVEPWDGPAALCFTDGTRIGAHARSQRPPPGALPRDEGRASSCMSSETGVLDIPAENIERKGRLEPGRMFLVDLEQGRIVEDEEIKDALAARKPYGKWLQRQQDLASPSSTTSPTRRRRVEKLPLARRARSVRLHATKISGS